MNLKKYISLILIFLILSHGIFQFLIFKVFEAKYKREIKLMIKQGFPEEKLVKFVFKKDIEKNLIPNFTWMKKNEFRFKGEMYDIVRSKIVGDSIYYSCIHDVKESKLFTNLERYLDNFLQKNPDKNNEFLILDNSLSKFYNSFKEEINKRYFFNEKNIYGKLLALLEGEDFIILPPPRIS